jgi:hypothetical protein
MSQYKPFEWMYKKIEEVIGNIPAQLQQAYEVFGGCINSSRNDIYPL